MDWGNFLKNTIASFLVVLVVATYAQKLLFDSFLILEHCIRHKQISSNKTAFNVDEALSIVLACKLPLFDQSALEGGTYVFIYTILRFFLNFNNMLYV